MGRMRAISFLFLVALLLLSGRIQAADGPGGAAPREDAAGRLSARLYPDHASFSTSRKARVFAEIINIGAAPVEINLWNLGQSMLALDIRNGRGERMLTIGPSTPQTPEVMKRYRKTLDPGKRIEIEYNLNIFSPELAAGTYSVKMVSIPSNTVRVSIRPWMFWK